MKWKVAITYVTDYSRCDVYIAEVSIEALSIWLYKLYIQCRV